MNYYRRYMADYGAKTAALSLAEHGAYNLLLDICYSTERGLPAGYDALYRLCRAMTKTEQDAVKSVADAFFPQVTDGLRHNQRADEEIAKAQATIAKQRESGVESAAKRWLTDGSTHKSTNAPPIQPPTTNHHTPRTNLQEPANGKSGARKRAIPLPGDFSISERVKTWAASKGHAQLERYLEFFTGRMKASGKSYVDWDEAFMNCIREDWPEIRRASAPDYSHLAAEPS